MPVVLPISAFNDNYIWLIKHQHQAIIIDPGQAAPVLQTLKQQQLRLNAILITHWHADHTGGIQEILQHYPDAQVIGPEHKNIAASTTIEDADSFTVAGLEFTAMHVPGHTLEHTVYYQHKHGWLFSGDTLFVAGCGRVFEGSYEQMLSSLEKIAELPANTKVFCAHEYTLSNLAFAQAVEPSNTNISTLIKESEKLRQSKLPTVPSTLTQELLTNPFLRLSETEVIESAKKQGAQADDKLSVFTSLREWKNNF